MSYARNVSLVAAGAFLAFALTYYGVVNDAGIGAFVAFFIGVVVWINELSDRRRNDKIEMKGGENG